MNSKILVIYTGGTIGMEKAPNGSYVPFSMENLLRHVPQIKRLGLELTIDSFKEPLDSAHIGPNEWLDISKRVSANYNDYHAFVILHGTDTMAYTASALSFLLHGLDKPVILTGSQIPISEEGTDGVDNFVNALKIAKEGLVNRVALWFHKSLHNGCSVTKIDSKDFDGFASPNHEVLVSLETDFIYNKDAFWLKKKEHNFLEKINSTVAFLSVLPITNKESQASLINESPIEGLVMSVLGSGTVPIREGDVIYNALINKNIPIIAISECLKGGVEIGKYEAGNVLGKLNVISGQKMTKEAAITKLIVALSNYDSREGIENYFKTNQVGEL